MKLHQTPPLHLPTRPTFESLSSPPRRGPRHDVPPPQNPPPLPAPPPVPEDLPLLPVAFPRPASAFPAEPTAEAGRRPVPRRQGLGVVGLRELQLAGRRQRVQGRGLHRGRGQGERDQGPDSDHGLRRRAAALAVEAGGSVGHRNQHDPCTKWWKEQC